MTSSEKRLGLLFTLVGPGGVGKNALINMVLAQLDNLRQLPTATTRPIRPNEQQGREHLFVTRQEFQQMIDTGALLEWQEVHPGRFYGVPRHAIENAIIADENLIADIEVYGATILRNRYPDNVILIFVAPPSMSELLTRMQERGDSQGEIDKRLQRVALEMPYAPTCDYMIINDNMAHAAENLKAIILAERSRSALANHRVANGLPRHRLTYAASVLLLYNDEILITEVTEALPMSRFFMGELPHEAALRVLSETVNIQPDINNLRGNTPIETSTYLPPLAVENIPQAQFEQITFTYLYTPSERIPAPEGWQWRSLEDIVLSDSLMRALALAGVVSSTG